MTPQIGCNGLVEGAAAPLYHMPAPAHAAVSQRMATVRHAFRLHRLAQAHRGRWMFCLEHNLFDEAKDSRLLMIEHLRSACQQWRMILGTGLLADDRRLGTGTSTRG